MVPISGNGPNGTRTPRRVQWTSESHIVSMHQLPPEPASPSGSGVLDETNIDEVRAALEQYRRNPSRRERPPSSLSMASSGDDETRAGTDEDYDYRLDTDPPGEPLEPQISAGSARSVAEHTNLQNILDNGINEHVTDYIPLGETDGLPNVHQDETRDQLSEARNLVRAHTGKWGVLRRRVKGASAVHHALGRARGAQDPEKAVHDQNAFASRYPEPDESAQRGGDRRKIEMAPIPNGASVLSSLLALYGQQSLPSGTTSAASSRASSVDGGSDDDEARKQQSNSQGRRASTSEAREEHHQRDSPSPADVVVHEEHRPANAGDLGLSTHHPSKSTPNLVNRPAPSPGYMGLINKARDQMQNSDRPKAARSGAGVFGALIQEAGNLSAAATPAASALAPAARRPGYQLNRYSLPDANASQGTAHPWRPESRPSSRPPSIHSSTAVSRDDDSPKDGYSFKKTVSSDDMLTMRNEKKRPKHMTFDSLGKFSGRALKEGGQALKQTEKWLMSGGKTPLMTPDEKGMTEYFSRPLTEDERRRKEWEAEKKRRKKQKEARKKQEIFVGIS